MKLHRIGLKYFVEDPDAVDLEALIPVFHRWIQNATVPGRLIDVADYKHVHHGPGVMLIAHECDYSMDMGEGHPGLYYVRKRETGGDVREALRLSLRPLLSACAALEAEQSPAGKIRFRTDELRLVLLDRLHAPNTAATLAAVQDDLRELLGQVYDGQSITLERTSEDSRDCCTLVAKISGAVPLATLVSRAEEQVSTAG